MENILFLLFTILGSIINLGLGLVFALASRSTIISGTGGSLPPPVWWAVAFGFLFLCGIPGTYHGLKVVLERDDDFPENARIPYLLAIPIFLSGLLLGYLAFSKEIFPSAFAPLAKLISISAVAFFVIQIVRRQGSPISQRRLWAQFTIGLWLVPIFALIAELLALLPTLLIFILGASTSENGREVLEILTTTPSPSIAELTQAAEGIILEPWFVAILVGVFAVLVPLIEESLKTLPVWPWVIKGYNSTEAFLGGVIGGAGYGIFESVFLIQSETTWFPTLMGRAGGIIMHAFTTGVASWGVSQGVGKKRWGRMLVGFLVAVTFHGLWNSGALSIALLEIKETQTSSVDNALMLVKNLIPVSIFGLTLIAFLGLIQFTKRFGASTPARTAADVDRQ